MICGFTINDLGVKEENIYVRVIEELVQRMIFLRETIVSLVDHYKGNPSEKGKILLQKFYK